MKQLKAIYYGLFAWGIASGWLECQFVNGCFYCSFHSRLVLFSHIQCDDSLKRTGRPGEDN